MKPKIRLMTVQLSCKRKGAATEGVKVEWKEPEEKALTTYRDFHKQIDAMLKAHGLMGGEK